MEFNFGIRRPMSAAQRVAPRNANVNARNASGHPYSVTRKGAPPDSVCSSFFFRFLFRLFAARAAPAELFKGQRDASSSPTSHRPSNFANCREHLPAIPSAYADRSNGPRHDDIRPIKSRIRYCSRTRTVNPLFMPR